MDTWTGGISHFRDVDQRLEITDTIKLKSVFYTS